MGSIRVIFRVMAGKRLQKPRVLGDVQFPDKSVYSRLPQRVNLSFQKRKSFPYLEVFKSAIVLAVVAVLILGHTVAPTAPVLAVDPASEAERAQLESKLKDLESQIADAQAQAAAYQKQGNTLKSEVGKLNAKIAGLALEMKANEYAIQQLDFQMSDNQGKINQTKQDMVSATNSLALILRQIYQTDKTNVVSIFLRSQKLSDFFNDVNNLASLQDGLRTSINQITDLKAKLEDEQQTLALNKADKEEVQTIKQQQKAETDQTKAEKNQLLAVTKGQESKYQELVASKKQEAAQIRGRIFQLLGGGEMSFGDAYKLAKLAGDATGVRPAFILAILDRESALGQNVGKCTYQTAMSPKPKLQSDGSYKSDVDIFLALAQALNLQSPETLSVSCANADGPYGGAMGPAQFIPSTWMMYSAQISSITGRTPANPWNNGDAFVAAALYLKNSGAATNETTAAAKYYCGGRWNRYVCTNVYAKKVLDQAANFEDDIATLNQ